MICLCITFVTCIPSSLPLTEHRYISLTHHLKTVTKVVSNYPLPLTILQLTSLSLHEHMQEFSWSVYSGAWPTCHGVRTFFIPPNTSILLHRKVTLVYIPTSLMTSTFWAIFRSPSSSPRWNNILWHSFNAHYNLLFTLKILIYLESAFVYVTKYGTLFLSSYGERVSQMLSIKHVNMTLLGLRSPTRYDIMGFHIYTWGLSLSSVIFHWSLSLFLH